MTPALSPILQRYSAAVLISALAATGPYAARPLIVDDGRNSEPEARQAETWPRFIPPVQGTRTFPG